MCCACLRSGAPLDAATLTLRLDFAPLDATTLTQPCLSSGFAQHTTLVKVACCLNMQHLQNSATLAKQQHLTLRPCLSPAFGGNVWWKLSPKGGSKHSLAFCFQRRTRRSSGCLCSTCGRCQTARTTARSLVDCSAFRPSVHFTAFACVCTTFHCLSLCLHYLLLHFTAFHCVCTVVQSAFHCLSLCLRHFSEPFTAFQLCFHCLRVHFTFLVLCTAAQGEHAVFDGLARRHDHDHRFIFEEVRA